MKAKVYHIEKCGTCKKAAAWLSKKGISADYIPIKEKTPSRSELKRAHSYYKSWSRIFNTSGMEYRSRNLSQKMPTMSDQEILNLLVENGMLIKRPFLVTENHVAAGFNEDQWQKIFSHEK